MDRKEIKKERIKRYFLDAAKDIIKTEGLANLTTKKIGDKAAYSCASIYNYFENFNELVCLCLEEMAAESAQKVAARITGSTPRERILSCARLMIDENASNPFIYSPFLSTDIDYSYFMARDGRHFVHPAYPLILGEISALPAIQDDVKNTGAGAPTADARTLADILTYIFHSKLHFFIRYGTPATLEELQDEVQTECRFILDRVTR